MKVDVLKKLASEGTQHSALASHALEAIEKNDEKMLVKLADAVDKAFSTLKPKNADSLLVGAYAEIIGAYIEKNGAFPEDPSRAMEWALLHAAFTEGPAFFGEE